MILTITARFAALVALVAATPVPHGHQYIPPGPGDVRSPCPGINSLANHGFLPRNGKNLTVANCIAALQEGLNVGADFASAAALLGIASNPDPLATSFDMDMVDQHNFPIEHDGSLSREDYYEGNDHSFNQTVFNEVLAYYKGMTIATIPVASNARVNRVDAARAINPTFIYGPRQAALSYGETALYLSVMGDPITGKAPIAYIKSFFEKQELPYSLGWSKPLVQTNFATLGVMIAELGATNPQAIPEGLTLGEGALRDVWQLKNPLTGKLENATCILANDC